MFSNHGQRIGTCSHQHHQIFPLLKSLLVGDRVVTIEHGMLHIIVQYMEEQVLTLCCELMVAYSYTLQLEPERPLYWYTRSEAMSQYAFVNALGFSLTKVTQSLGHPLLLYTEACPAQSPQSVVSKMRLCALSLASRSQSVLGKYAWGLP
jgi:hypothetical protein